ncbi:DNA-primase RepB domain-containing protein [Marivita sp.]|uniref:DNA-primase RepB domain-containing protein n=1 Tax=Marivita sp. TaxID=2003365 RepID=UPI003B596FC9
MNQTDFLDGHARAFLKMLDPHANSFYFRKLPDNASSQVSPRNLDGKLKEVLVQLQRANRAGGGAFVVINEGGHKDGDITRVRAVFADTDGAPVEPIIDALEPHMVVETSPKKYHVYWLVADFPLDQFKPVQLAIATQFGTDESVTNLSRVMRLPGLFHNKNEPVLSRLVNVNWQLPRYTLDEVVMRLSLQLMPPNQDRQPSEWNGTGKTDVPPIKEVEKALTYLNPFVDRELWFGNILALAHDYGEGGRDLAHRWSRGDLWNGERDGA